MVTAVALDGIDRSCDMRWDVRVTSGRRSVRESGAASTASVLLETTDPSSDLGAPVVFRRLEITEDGLPLFAGVVTDAAVTHVDPPAEAAGPPTAAVQMQAVGALGWAASAFMGDEPWPAETVAQRAARIAAGLPVPFTVQGGGSQQVRALDVDRRTMLDLLTDLAASTGGYLLDTTHPGTGEPEIVLQALDARRVDVQAPLWSTEPAAEPWDALDGETTWLDEDWNPYRPLYLDCSQIEWQPTWVQALDVATRVTVAYGPDPDDPAEAVAVDGDAAALYGIREADLESQLVEAGDASTLAALILSRSAHPQWRLQSVAVPLDDVDDDTAWTLLTARPGTRITLTGVPPPAPLGGFPGVLEGWEYATAPDTGRVLTLYLSHVAHSLALPTWDAEPVEAVWDDLTDLDLWENDL